MMYHQQAMAEKFTFSSERINVSGRLIDEINDLYYGHFDNYWFISLLEQNAFDSSRFRCIHNMLEIPSGTGIEMSILTDGIDAFEEIIIISKRYLLPALRDKLEISGFYRSKAGSREELVRRELFSYTFPYNLKRLETLIAELKQNI